MKGYILVHSVSHAFGIERLLKKAGIDCKTGPIPRSLSSDCGICVCFEVKDREKVEATLSLINVDIQEIAIL